MDFGSNHIYLVRAVAVASDQGIQPSVQPEISGTRSAGQSLHKEAEAIALSSAMPKSRAVLTYKDAILDPKNVYNLTEHVVDWFGLGTQLDITNSRLKKIRLENDSEDGRRREMIVSWLYGDPEASWEKLSKALVRVDHRVLADRIDREILPLLQHGKYLKAGPRPDSAHVRTAMYGGNAEKYFHGAPSHKSRSIRKGPQPSDSAMENLLVGDECDSDIPTKRTSRSEDKDTNILMIKFGALSKPCKVHTGDPVVCSNDQCAAILNYHSKIIKETGVEGNVWICEFCGTKNTIEIEAGEVPEEGDILYLQQHEHSSKHDTLVSGITKDSIVVFCVDTSGSMGVTTEVPGKKELKGHEKLQRLREIYAGSGIQYMPGRYNSNVTYISRLQCVQAAIDHQLTTLAQNNPIQKVAIVMFGDEVTVTGDGRPENEFVFVGEKLWKESAMLKLIKNIPTPSPMKESRELLKEKIFSIEEEGQTALGGALLVSVELAKRVPGSKVILCTDGLANRGIGNLDDQKFIESSVAFYKKLGVAAKESSVSVSVLTIKGTDCDLVHLGEVANLSGGDVEVVDPTSLSEEFVNILSTSVVAVQVNARIILHSKLSFKDGDGKNTLSVPVGNVVDTTTLMYEFSSSEKNASTCGSEVPFQVQIKYTSLDGQQCLRVFTEVRPTTSDKRVANQGAKDDVLMTHKLRKEGRGFLARAKRGCHLSFDDSEEYLLMNGMCSRMVDSFSGHSEGLSVPRPRPETESSPRARRPMMAKRRSTAIFDGHPGSVSLLRRSKLSLKKTTKSEAQGILMNKGRPGPTTQSFSEDSMIVSNKPVVQRQISQGKNAAPISSHHRSTISQQVPPVTLSLSPSAQKPCPKSAPQSNSISSYYSAADACPKYEGLMFKKRKRSSSVLDCDQNLDEPRTLYDEQSISTPRRSNSSPYLPHSSEHNTSPKTKKVLTVTQRSRSLTNLSQEYPHDREKNEHRKGKGCRGYHLRGHRQDTESYQEIEAVPQGCIVNTPIPSYYNNSMAMPRLASQTVGRRTYSSVDFADETFDMQAASAYQKVQGKVLPVASKRTVEVQKHITLSNEGYGFGFLVSPGKGSGTVVQSLIPNGVAWKQGELRNGDKLLAINNERVENMPHQDVVKKLRLLNEEATNSVTLCVLRKEDPAEQVLPERMFIDVSLQGHKSKSFGLAFKFNDSQQLIIEEIRGDGIAKMDGRLKVNDVVLVIDGEEVSEMATNDISTMMKEIEERSDSDSLELLVMREAPISSSSYGHRKVYSRALRTSSWSQPSSQTPEQETNSDEIFISLCNQGQGFGFTVQETEDKSVVVSTVFPEGVADNDGHLRANDKLIEINGRKVSDMTYKEVVAVLRALNDDDYSTVDLKIKRNVY